MKRLEDLGEHPVTPIHKSAHRSASKGGSVEPVVDADLCVVAAMAHVVTYHGPPHADCGGEAQRCDGVESAKHANACGGKANGIQYVGPAEHLLHVHNVLLDALRIAVLLLDSSHLLSPCLEVDFLPPLWHRIVSLRTRTTRDGISDRKGSSGLEVRKASGSAI